jgi:cobalt-zinc-cadmium efflux system outer membrane protein
MFAIPTRSTRARLLLAASTATALVLSTPLAAQIGPELSTRGGPGSRTLTLDEAFARTLARHPDLARFRYLQQGAQAALDEAAQSPALSAGLQLENAPGNGAASGFDQAETTLSLASILELGGKREARQAVANAQMQALTLDEEARRLDLLAEVARRFLDLLAAQSSVQIADAELAQRERVAEAAAQRVRAGASPESVRLGAEAAVARARLVRERSLTEKRAAARRLAALWNERNPDFDSAAGDPLDMPSVPSLERLQALLDRSPELRRFADEARLREARVQLARTARAPDIQWQAGIRRLEETDNWAAVVGVSVPLGSARRAAPRVRAAEAEVASLALERESEEISLYATLADAQARLSAASGEVSIARTDVLPRLQQAEQLAERAYRAGALSYLEWAQLQAETTATKREELQAAIEGHRALIEIQRLTGESFIASTRAERQP